MSGAWFMVITSACRPPTTLIACLDEPPCDCWTVTASPLLPFQYFWNAGL